MAQSSNNSVQFPPLSAIGQGRFPSMSSPTHNVDHPFEDAMTYSRETRADPPNLRTEDWENRLAALPEDNRESKHLERQGKPKRRSLSERCSEKWKQVRRGFSSHFNRPAQDTIVTPTTNNGSLLRGTTQNTRYTLSTPDVHHLPLPTPPSNFVSLENLLPDKPEAVNQLLRPSTASQHDLSYPPIPQSNHESVARTRSTTSDGDRRDLRPRVSFDSRLKYGPCPQPDRDSSKRSRSAGSSCRKSGRSQNSHQWEEIPPVPRIPRVYQQPVPLRESSRSLGLQRGSASLCQRSPSSVISPPLGPNSEPWLATPSFRVPQRATQEHIKISQHETMRGRDILRHHMPNFPQAYEPQAEAPLLAEIYTFDQSPRPPTAFNSRRSVDPPPPLFY